MHTTCLTYANPLQRAKAVRIVQEDRGYIYQADTAEVCDNTPSGSTALKWIAKYSAGCLNVERQFQLRRAFAKIRKY